MKSNAARHALAMAIEHTKNRVEDCKGRITNATQSIAEEETTIEKLRLEIQELKAAWNKLGYEEDAS